MCSSNSSHPFYKLNYSNIGEFANFIKWGYIYYSWLDVFERDIETLLEIVHAVNGGS